ncbi:MAG TPA: AMP-binding protein [Blastocatellia bacterium]|nr:AMP-binding protein [Blastocatellia bacterium]
MTTDETTPRLEQFDSYERACQEFSWRIPEHFNLADAVCRRHKDAVTRPALLEVRPAAENLYTFGAINYLSDKFANVLKDCGLRRGDVVAAMLPQSAALPVAHLAALKLGGVVLPLAPPMEAEAVAYRLKDSAAKFLIADANTPDKLDKITGRLPSLETVFVASDGEPGELRGGHKDFWWEVRNASSYVKAIETDANTPAFIFYRADSGGDPAGVVYPHGLLIGQLPAFEMLNNFDLGAETIFWTPDDWASIHPLFSMLYPAWHYGCPVVAYNAADADDILTLLERNEITNLLVTPELLKTLLDATERKLSLRNIYVTDSPVAPELYEQARSALGVTINEGYGFAEAPLVTANCGRWFAAKPGSLGRAAPGHTIEIVDEQGNILPRGDTGFIALRLPNPSLAFQRMERLADDLTNRLEGPADRQPRGQRPRLNGIEISQPQTALNVHQVPEAISAQWFITGEKAFKDEDGYLWRA